MKEWLSRQRKRALFHFRWLFMSPERRYAYLWNRTKHSHYNY